MGEEIVLESINWILNVTILAIGTMILTRQLHKNNQKRRGH